MRSLAALSSFLLACRMCSFLLFATQLYVLCHVSSSTFPHSFLCLPTTTMPVNSLHSFCLRRELALRSLCLSSCFLTHPSFTHAPRIPSSVPSICVPPWVDLQVPLCVPHEIPCAFSYGFPCTFSHGVPRAFSHGFLMRPPMSCFGHSPMSFL